MTMLSPHAGLLSVFLVLGVGCAHQQAAESTTDPVEEELRHIRKENARLKDRVELLEDRMLQIEGRGGSEDLPVVRLRPSHGAASRRTAAPEPAAAPVPRRKSITLGRPEPEPSPALGYGAGTPVTDARPAPAEDPEPAPQPVESPESGGPEPIRSFKLEGSRLVELTRTKRPPPPPAPARSTGTSKRRTKRRGDRVIQQYEDAMELLKGGANEEAYRAFDRIARDHPRHDYADNALYWKGEAAYDQGHFSDALTAFTDVVEKYGGGNKAPDALLKIGLCYHKVGDQANAVDVLTELIEAYPRARASDIARLKLAEFQG